MSTVFAFIISLAVAGVLAWTVRRYELSRYPKETACSRAMNEVFANSGDTPDSVLLTRMLTHRDACLDDAAFADQLRRLMVTTQQMPQAHSLLEEADRRHTFKPDEMKAQEAWVALGDAQDAWMNDNVAQAKVFNANATATANALRARWPEWSLPYRILDDASRATYMSLPPDTASTSAPPDYYRIQDKIRSRVMNGAAVRNFGDSQAIAYVFLLTAVGMLGVFASLGGFLAIRELKGTPLVQAANANAGRVALRGTLQLMPNTTAIIGPFSNEPGVWYEQETHSGVRRSTVQVQRSGQSFALRDASGDVEIVPQGVNVRTTHSKSTYGRTFHVFSTGGVTERMLKEGDSAYVIGELKIESVVGGAPHRRVVKPANGKQLMVSNFTLDQLLGMEQLWQWAGMIVFGASILLLWWSYVQRYHVTTAPGTLL